MKKWTSILVIVIIVIGLSTGGILTAREMYFKQEAEEVVTAETGDQVEMNYVGKLRDPEIYDAPRIFDTSYEDIPNVKSPKYTYTYDHERERGEPFQFTLGEGVIEGWNENIKGMREGQSKRFSVSPKKGYGESSEDLIYQIPKTETVPVYEEMGSEEFSQKHGSPSKNMKVEDEFWGWDKIVISVGDDTVKLRHDPEIGQNYHSYSEEGLISQVKSIDSNADGGNGEIKVENTVRKSTRVRSEHLSLNEKKFAGVPQQKANLGQSQDGQGIVSSENGNITVDFNDEVVGKTLYFEVELVSIEK